MNKIFLKDKTTSYKLQATSSRGFTLIELLVVVAIIGILSSVVLASLNTARSKGTDAAIRANMASIRPQAEIYYDGAGLNTYGSDATDCDDTASLFGADTTITGMIKAANKAAGLSFPDSTGSQACELEDIPPQQWAVATKLKNPDPVTAGEYWCVDSQGHAQYSAASSASAAVAQGICN
jgi:prepilin-type N-terminal cleavage/methylation domain-containing protein